MDTTWLSSLPALLIGVADLAAALLFMYGLHRMASPATAASGISVAGIGMAVAVLASFLYAFDVEAAAKPDLLMNLGLAVVALALGGAVAWWAGRTVAMTAMPQMVAIYNGLGGGAAGAIAAVELFGTKTHGMTALIVTLLGALIGAVSMSGSLIAWAKLDGVIKKPLRFKGQQAFNGLVFLATLAVGAYLKNTVALAWGRRAVVSPHIGDLDSPRGREVFVAMTESLQQLYGVRAERIVHDAHPLFPNTHWARASTLPRLAVWHHDAHASALAGEHPNAAPLLCFTWDGMGVGPDRVLWGGEALYGGPGHWRRVASFRPFRLPGGERAARQPWRSALSLCWESDTAWPSGDAFANPLLRQAFDERVNTPSTSAVGRLFDGAAALLGLCAYAGFEGEAPLRLEALCRGDAEPIVLPLARDHPGVLRSDWASLVPALLDERRSRQERATLFHESLAAALCAQACEVRTEFAVQRVGLCGGVFQNRVLTERARTLLQAAGFEVLIPRFLPVGDAAISFGQLVESAATGAGSHGVS